MKSALAELPPGFFKQLAMNLIASAVLTWVLFPAAVSVSGIKFYRMTGSAEQLHLTELWVSQGFLAIAGTALTFLFWLQDRTLWVWFAFFTALIWGGDAVMEFVASPKPQGTITALLFLVVPTVQLIVAGVVGRFGTSTNRAEM